MGLGTQTHCRRSLLHGLQRIFDLVQTSLGRKDGVVGIVSVPELLICVSVQFKGAAMTHTMAAS